MKYTWMCVCILVVCSVLLMACGYEENARQNDLGAYEDIKTESEVILEDDGKSTVLGVQYYNGVPIRISAVKQGDKVDIYKDTQDGNSELLLQGISEDYRFYSWYMDAEGCFYCWAVHGNIVKLDTSGREIFRKSLADMNLQDLRGLSQLPDGRVFVTYAEGQMISEWTLGEVNSATGEITKVNEVRLPGMGYIATGDTGLLYMDLHGVWEIDVDTGVKTELMMFAGTSLLLAEEPEIKAFCFLEDGSVELLRYDLKGERAILVETLRMEKLNEEKQVLVMRGEILDSSKAGKWMREQIASFNQQSETSYIVLEECPYGGDEEEFARQTSVQIATGKGPDILYGDVLGDYVYSMIQKGVFLDVKPLMEASGMREEDYFPVTFDCWREGEKIYGVNLRIQPEGYRISETVLGSREEPTIETLINALSEWQEPARYLVFSNCDSQWLIKHFLQGSENLWGMIDWEEHSCEFDTELFAKMLEVSKRYGYDERKNYEAVAEDRIMEHLPSFDTQENQETEGMVLVGTMFDDGIHVEVDCPTTVIAINANSANLDAAWEFVSYLLDVEQQLKMTGNTLPANREAFLIKQKKDIEEWIALGRPGLVYPENRGLEQLTDEKVAEYNETLEGARALPIKTEPILDIICEEAVAYFSDSKSIEEVVAVVENRVQLYLDERK